ncbi:MAG TPA: aminopeptidase [candidate division Zixibacteria bacterium]|nr:aminopeptidase [candidate division Zixibacteria bacterium]
MQEQLRASADVAIKECLAVQPHERVLVITDTKLHEVGEVLFRTAAEIAETAMVTILPRKSHGEEPPPDVAEMMKAYDVLIIPTDRSMSHTEARRNACKAGARCATLPNILPETMVRAMNADYRRIADLSIKMAELITKATSAQVTTPAGTDLSFSLDGMTGIADTGILHKPGGFTNLPAGEAYSAPVEGTARGTLVIDGAIADTGVLSPDDHIHIDVENGYAVTISGGKSAEYLLSIMEPHGKKAFNIAELGIGTNYKAKLIGSILEDEKALGTIHIAMGDNRSMGGNIRVASHLDGILLRPSLYFDGEPIIVDGEIVV